MRPIIASLLASLSLSLAAPAVAQSLSPDAQARRAIHIEERGETLDELFAELARTRSPAEARLIEGRIWSEWMGSGSATIDLMMAWAARAAGSEQQGIALDYLDQVILMVPDYAEAWNRRATLHFMRGDYALSIRDIEETLAREPRHFGALAGLGQIMVRQGRPRRGARRLRPRARRLSRQPERAGGAGAAGGGTDGRAALRAPDKTPRIGPPVGTHRPASPSLADAPHRPHVASRIGAPARATLRLGVSSALRSAGFGRRGSVRPLGPAPLRPGGSAWRHGSPERVRG